MYTVVFRAKAGMRTVKRPQLILSWLDSWAVQAVCLTVKEKSPHATVTKNNGLDTFRFKYSGILVFLLRNALSLI